MRVTVKYEPAMKPLLFMDIPDLSISMLEAFKEQQACNTYGILTVSFEDKDTNELSYIKMKVIEPADKPRFPKTLDIGHFLWTVYLSDNGDMETKALKAFIEMCLKDIGFNLHDMYDIKTEELFEDIIGVIPRTSEYDYNYKSSVIEALEEQGNLRKMRDSDIDEIFEKVGMWYVPPICVVTEVSITRPEIMYWWVLNIVDIFRAYVGEELDKVFFATEISKESVADFGINTYTVESLLEVDTKGVYKESSRENAQVLYLEYEPEDYIDEEIESIDYNSVDEVKNTDSRRAIFTIIK